MEKRSLIKLRKQTGLSQAAFSKKYNIPKRTIENWEMYENNSESANARKLPDYIYDLLYRVVKEDFGID